MDDKLIAETADALDRALARIAIAVAGTRERAEQLMTSVSKGERDEFTGAFLSQGAAMMRARLLLADARMPPTSLRRRSAA